MDDEVFLQVEDELYSILVQLDPGDGMLQVHASEVSDPSEVVWIID